MIFLHGWPGVGLQLRAQMEAFASVGWHCVAPDLRGFGGSSAPAAKEAYTIKNIVADMAEFHDHLGGKVKVNSSLRRLHLLSSLLSSCSSQ